MKGSIKTTIAIILVLGIIATAIIAVISDGFTLPVEQWGDRLGADNEQEKPVRRGFAS